MKDQRVIYKKNPLIEVIIQFRFPRILALNSKDPEDFQDAIRENYPIYQLTLENKQEISLNINQNDLSAPIQSIVQRKPVKNHSFITSEGTYKINLTNEFISISTLKYHRWEEMLAHFQKPLEAFERIYNPPFYERIGLRYIDAFSRKELGLGDTPWSELIQTGWLGAFAFAEENKVVNSGLDVEYYLDQANARAKIHTGLGTLNGSPEKVFIADGDFIVIDKIKRDDTNSVLEYLHTNAKVFISDVIKEKLHYAMKPETIE